MKEQLTVYGQIKLHEETNGRQIRHEDIEEETNGIKTPAEKKQQEETQPRMVTEKVVSQISEEQHQ